MSNHALTPRLETRSVPVPRYQRSADAAAERAALLICPEWKYGNSAPAYAQMPPVRLNAVQKLTRNGSTIDVELHSRISPRQPHSPAKTQAGEKFSAFHRPASSSCIHIDKVASVSPFR